MGRADDGRMKDWMWREGHLLCSAPRVRRSIEALSPITEGSEGEGGMDRGREGEGEGERERERERRLSPCAVVWDVGS